MSENEAVALPFEQRVWDELSRIDVSDHADQLPKTQKRPAVSYLAWHKAWAILKRRFPASTYSHRPDIIHGDGTMEVEVDVIISYNGTETMFTNARLGVMDNWFGPIANPNAREINDARQRALVKALAFAGLGLNLWSDSAIPVGKIEDPISPDQYDHLMELIKTSESDLPRFLKWCDVDDLAEMPFSRYSSAVGLLEAKIRRMVTNLDKGDES
jgi:hypothetical protein